MSDAPQGLSRQPLQAALAGGDEEVNRFVTAIGLDAVLEHVLGQVGAVLPADADAVQWDIGLPDQSVARYTTSSREGDLVVRKEPAEGPRVTLALSLADLLRLAIGELDGLQAFMAGRLRVRGDIMLAQSLQGWL